jgi:hypothetical protein
VAAPATQLLPVPAPGAVQQQHLVPGCYRSAAAAKQQRPPTADAQSQTPSWAALGAAVLGPGPTPPDHLLTTLPLQQQRDTATAQLSLTAPSQMQPSVLPPLQHQPAAQGHLPPLLLLVAQEPEAPGSRCCCHPLPIQQDSKQHTGMCVSPCIENTHAGDQTHQAAAKCAHRS